MSRGRRRLVVALVAALVVLAVTTVRVFIEPDLPPLPERVDAIIELGGPGDRDAVTLALAATGMAGTVVQSTTEDEAGTSTCLPPTPGVRTECFHADPPTTRGEARYIGRRAAELGWHSVLLVTTPDHAWRARLRVMRCFPGRVYVSTSPLPRLMWPRQIPYQWAASGKALLVERDC